MPLTYEGQRFFFMDFSDLQFVEYVGQVLYFLDSVGILKPIQYLIGFRVAVAIVRSVWQSQ